MAGIKSRSEQFLYLGKFINKNARVDLHKLKVLTLHFPTPKMLIIQLPTSNVWKNANHTIFIQFQKTNEKRFDLVSPAI